MSARITVPVAAVMTSRLRWTTLMNEHSRRVVYRERSDGCRAGSEPAAPFFSIDQNAECSGDERVRVGPGEKADALGHRSKRRRASRMNAAAYRAIEAPRGIALGSDTESAGQSGA